MSSVQRDGAAVVFTDPQRGRVAHVRKFLKYAKTFTPQVLFRGFTPDSGGEDERLNGPHGVVPHGILDGTIPTSMWRTLHLSTMVSGHRTSWTTRNGDNKGTGKKGGKRQAVDALAAPEVKRNRVRKTVNYNEEDTSGVNFEADEDLDYFDKNGRIMRASEIFPNTSF
ncbi:hypothetical protein KVR01_007265 [Diaporthe batatas]|uniref:uncharacterized protein n=1 Tax=Diaporthe batatas TaxID=748121 RepID=UPI001D05819C|nr:uncharacterized protein KVR01_007265 [Diaporthe batatas]KAG8162787.1 hypothetical protein KVR01_007265 [Diaporthe batatas]